jgi:hypothetical protein
MPDNKYILSEDFWTKGKGSNGILADQSNITPYGGI